MKLNSEHNSFARLCNSSISRIDSALMPLVDPNNQPIVGFPADVGQIQAYNGDYPIPALLFLLAE